MSWGHVCVWGGVPTRRGKSKTIEMHLVWQVLWVDQLIGEDARKKGGPASQGRSRVHSVRVYETELREQQVGFPSRSNVGLAEASWEVKGHRRVCES